MDESLYNFDTAGLYRNFLNLILDVQTADGEIPDTVPLTYGGYPADPNWGTAYPTIGWALYDHYGDLSVIRDHYNGTKAWVDWVRRDYVQGHGLTGIEYKV